MFVSVNAQNVKKLNEYKASNGITYKIGDEIKLGKGSNDNGNIVYVTMVGWAHLSQNETERCSFTEFRASVKKAITPHEVDHIDFVADEIAEQGTPNAAKNRHNRVLTLKCFENMFF